MSAISSLCCGPTLNPESTSTVAVNNLSTSSCFLLRFFEVLPSKILNTAFTCKADADQLPLAPCFLGSETNLWLACLLNEVRIAPVWTTADFILIQCLDCKYLFRRENRYYFSPRCWGDHPEVDKISWPRGVHARRPVGLIASSKSPQEILRQG